MKKIYLIDSLKFCMKKSQYINKPNIKEFFKVSIGGVLVLAFLPVLFCNEWHWSEKNRMTKNNFPVI